MLKIDILSRVYLFHHHYWQCAGLSFSKLATIFGKDGGRGDVAKSIETPSECNPWITEALTDQKVINSISALLGTSEIWQANTWDDVSRCLAHESLDGWVPPKLASPAHPSLEILTNNAKLAEGDFALSDIESRTLRRLAKNISAATRRLLVWRQDRFSGVNFLTSLLDPSDLGDHVKTIILLSPVDAGDYYTAGMKALCDHLGIAVNGGDQSEQILQLLDEKSILVVAKHAEHMPRIPRKLGTNAFANLIIRCTRERGTVPPRVLLVGDVALEGIKREDFEDVSKKMDGLSIPRAKRLDFFMHQVQRFDTMRGNPHQYDGGGFRPKRARWQLESDSSPESYSIDIRMRAFFASNHENLSYADPTAGLRHLSGKLFHAPPIDVLEYIRAAYLYVDGWSRTTKQSELQVLRWVSTGIYWLTESMLTELRKARYGTVTKIDGKSLDGRLRDIEGVVKWSNGNIKKPNDHAETYYQMSLGLRAYVQEHWRIDAPYNRSVAHYTIAKRLHDLQNNRNQLSYEFPFRPHWGRTRHYFLSETLRHLVRASEVPHHEIAKPETGNQKKVARDFPEKPQSSNRHRLSPNGYCDPFQTEKYCYEQIFHRALNGNEKLTDRSRSLANRHGAYHMTAELLQLMGDSQALLEPSPYFPKEHRYDYFSRLGFSYLDLGGVENARYAFGRALTIATDLNAKGNIFQSMIDASLLETVVGTHDSLEKAKTILNEAEMLGQSIGSDDVSKMSASNMRKKLTSRFAHLAYFQGDLKGAIELYQQMDLRRMPSDAAHCYIAALHRPSPLQDQELALSICLQQIFQNTSNGHQHEALGFRIALSHSLRKMNQLHAAEKNLDKVQEDIINYGCSERIFASFLLESGRTLIDQKRYCEAYCNYLYPGYERATGRKMYYMSEQLKKYALQSLIEMEKEFQDFGSDEEWQEHLASHLTKKGLNPIQSDAARRHQFPIDPLASYEFDEFEVSNNIFTLKGILREKNDLSSVQSWS